MGNDGHATTWSPEMSDYLANEFNAGKTTAQLIEGLLAAFQVKVTRNAIAGRVRRLRQTPGLITRDKVPINTQTKEAKRENARVKKQKQLAVLRAAPAPRMYSLPTLPSAPVPEPIGVSLLVLERGMCAYPYGAGVETTFCGHPVAHRSYCAAHAGRCYKPGEPK